MFIGRMYGNDLLSVCLLNISLLAMANQAMQATMPPPPDVRPVFLHFQIYLKCLNVLKVFCCFSFFFTLLSWTFLCILVYFYFVHLVVVHNVLNGLCMHATCSIILVCAKKNKKKSFFLRTQQPLQKNQYQSVLFQATNVLNQPASTFFKPTEIPCMLNTGFVYDSVFFSSSFGYASISMV